ncbi:MAG: MBL fold metallo-hydrolase [bacterium]
MQLQFLGAARTVTGSMHLISVNGSRVLLDCGLFQGRRAESYERNKRFPFDASTIDAVVLSHAHIDHAGNLPNLVRNGFEGPIYCTLATHDLCHVMLYDSAYIQERDSEFVNKKHAKRNEPAVDPLYTAEDVDQTMSQMTGVDYRKEIEVAGGVVISFHDAGHILGSAVTRIELEEHGRKITLGFTGDLGRKNMPILKDPDPIGAVDVFISESTYGGKSHDPVLGMENALLEVMNRTVKRGGKIIVPAFSVGKTQEFLYVLFKLYDDGRLPSIPIYVDSPLAVNATEVFRKHPECFDEETSAYIQQHEDPFGFGRLRYIRNVEESKKLNDLKEPCMIISASGMCEAGRIVHHLSNSIGDARNTVLVIGFMAEHTLGRRLVEKAPEIRMLGEGHFLKAEVVVLNSFSAHAGQDELLHYIEDMDRNRMKKIFLVHGELTQAQKLQALLQEKQYTGIFIPDRGEKVELS